MSEAEEPKLIIDEDWKTQVQREKEELKKQQQSEAETTTGAGPAPAQAERPPSDAGEADDLPPPPASLTLLVTTLATQAMAAMGLMPDEEDQAPAVNLGFAKHFIDTLAVLEEKTQGNLTPAEKSFLQDALHQLRMAYVSIRKP